jgi:hypothetical protein
MSYINVVPLTPENMFINSSEDAKAKYDEVNKAKYINLDTYMGALELVAVCAHLNEDLSLLCLKLKITATDYENIYPLFLAAPYLIDMDTIMENNSIYPLIRTCKVYKNTALALSAIQFITSYDYKLLNDSARTMFLKQMAQYSNMFILDTFKVRDIEIPCDYVVAASPSSIPKVKLPEVILGRPKKYYVDMMHENSYGLLDGFPWDAACITGGFVEKILSETISQCPYSDIDVWVIGENYDQRRKNMDAVLTHIMKLYGESRCYLVNRRSVIDIYVEDIPRSIQIISNDRCTMYDIISTFDLTHCSHGYSDGTFYCTTKSLQSLKTRCTQGLCVSNTSPTRIIKGIMANYNISEEVYNLQEITDALTDEKQIKSIIYSTIATWHPTSSIPDLETRRLYNSAMLVKGTNNDVIDAATALSSAVIGGTFNNDYNLLPFMRLNPVASAFRIITHMKRVLSEDGRKAYIQSDAMPITSFKIDTRNANDFTIFLTTTPSTRFREFMLALKEEYKAIWNSKVDLQEDNLLLKIESTRISYLQSKNQSVVVSNTNEPLDYNVLSTSVNIQVTFDITTYRNQAEFNKAFVFNVTRVVIV